MYRFQAQRNRGFKGEAMLDQLFGVAFDIVKATPLQQRRGIDRYMTGRLHGQRFSVEYKADAVAASSGCAFVEVDVAGAPGWALSSEADYLAYHVVGGLTYVVRMSALRALLPEWAGRFQRRTIRNQSYDATGILAPLDVLGGAADRVLGRVAPACAEQTGA